MSYRLENGELYPRATHPGSGEAAYWPEGETYTNTGQWPGAMITRETAQNLIQDKAPITLQEWHTRYRDTLDAIGNYWVIDHETRLGLLGKSAQWRTSNLLSHRCGSHETRSR
ncbi:hypothetical protein ACI1T6_08400 [Lactococcus petauri]|uniref:hypothetical protein n=1 Tax=Lactococcus petauri TaxID=1940789 RepID=UPI0038555AF8